jgi:hypothetical protein
MAAQMARWRISAVQFMKNSSKATATHIFLLTVFNSGKKIFYLKYMSKSKMAAKLEF